MATRESLTLQGQPVGRIKAGWILFKETWRFLMLDKELIWVPILTGIVNLLLFGVLVSAIIIASLTSGEKVLENDFFIYGTIFASYVIGAFTLALAQAATAHTVYTRVHGGNATLFEAMKVAFSYWGSLLVWSLITATVGVLLRFIYDRSKLLGQIITAVIGAAWSVLTYFVVPSMVIGKKSAFDSIGDSASTFKMTWGETFVSNISYGLILIGLHLLAILSLGGLAIFFLIIGLASMALFFFVLLLFWFVVMGLVAAAMNSVLKTLLYIYATEKNIPQNFNQELLEKMLFRKNPAPESYNRATVYETPISTN